MIKEKPLTILVLIYGLLIIYASLMPFDFVDGPHINHNLSRLFSAWPLNSSAGISGSDLLSNFVLYIPLGWLISTRCRVGCRSIVWSFTAGLTVCTLVSVGVEAAQLFSVFRTASAADWLFNTVGAVVGSTAGVIFGREIWVALIKWLKTNWNDRPLNIVTVALMMLLIADATSPYLPTILLKDVYHHLKKSQLSFSEGLSMHPWHWWIVNRALVYGTLTLLLFSWREHRNKSIGTWISAAIASTWFALILEILKLMIVSRTMNIANVAISCFGSFIAAGAGIFLSDRFDSRRKLEISISAILIYLTYLSWFPFDFNWSQKMLQRVHYSIVQLLPFYHYAMGAKLSYVQLFLQSILLLGLLTYLMKIRFGWFNADYKGVICAAILASGLGFVLESGQIFLPSRTPSATDIYCFAIGGALGAWIKRQSREGLKYDYV